MRKAGAQSDVALNSVASLRLAAVNGLAWMGGDAVPLLVNAIKDEDERIKTAATEAVVKAQQIAQLHAKLVACIVLSVLLIVVNLAYLIHVLRRRHMRAASTK